MKLNEALELFDKLISRTDKKSKIKVYKSFISILSGLKEKNFTNEQLQLIENELDNLKLIENTENKKRYFNKKLSELKEFLKKEFSLITEGYYTAIGMSLGVSFGVLAGTLYKEAIGTSIGIALGMFIGLFIGITLDNRAKKQGRVLKTTPG